MINKNNNLQESAKDHIVTLLSKIGVSANVEESVVGDTITFAIRTNEAGILIGEDGQSLSALNHIVKKIIEKEFKERPQFMIDVNDYKRKHYEELKDRARMDAQRVRYFKKEVAMQPMTAFDRRIVHMSLQEYPDIVTESIGDGITRRIVIKPYS